ncbi:hypothetical protein GQ53DRAFT_807088 [Thozetella sp. PMI_491]|nr:hypothetical protein GQ53DRAFT_807088 [Thozetella sp. PMI_491]
MKFSILALALVAATASAWLVRPPTALVEEAPPPCAVDSPLPCTCPTGTEFFYLQTWFSWGANAWSVYNLTGNFSDLSWVPQPIKLTIGPHNTVGSYRLTTIHIDVGVFDWFEEITEYSVEDDGSFVWAFELKNVPLEFPDGKGGSFAGEWERFEGRAAGEHQTDIYWNIYGCHSGGTHTFPLFQRYCLDHVNATLSEMGVLKGTTTEPFSEIWMGHKTGAVTKPGNLPPFRDPGQQYPLGRNGGRLSDLSDL